MCVGLPREHRRQGETNLSVSAESSSRCWRGGRHWPSGMFPVRLVVASGAPVDLPAVCRKGVERLRRPLSEQDRNRRTRAISHVTVSVTDAGGSPTFRLVSVTSDELGGNAIVGWDIGQPTSTDNFGHSGMGMVTDANTR